jgi:hypothetical protein
VKNKKKPEDDPVIQIEVFIMAVIVAWFVIYEAVKLLEDLKIID